MALIDLWTTDRAQVTDKRLHQLISFAGDGLLRDGNQTSRELRELLSAVSSDVLGRWIDEVLADRFTDFGLVLQDIINEIGARLGFTVQRGLYRGRQGQSGHDGLWQLEDGRSIILESKASTAYQINLARIADYRAKASTPLGLGLDQCTVLIVVGREATDDLEAQVRGSRYAWNVRLLGVDALFRLLKIKEAIDDPAVSRQIQEILIPQEFTRLDAIIGLVFATAEDAQEEESIEENGEEVDGSTPRTPASFHQEILPRLEKALKTTLVKQSRVIWSSPDKSLTVSCQVASKRDHGHGGSLFWFGLKFKTAEILKEAKDARCAFGLGSPDLVVVLPWHLVLEHLGGFFTTQIDEGGILHYHIRFLEEGGSTYLLVNRDRDRIDVTNRVLPP